MHPSSAPTAPHKPRQQAHPWSPSAVLILAGGVAALHVGKMPPAIPALQAALDVSLVQAGFLLSTAQLAGMLLGVLVGGLADGLGLRRSVLLGLWVLVVASLLSLGVSQTPQLLALRALEGLGVLLVVLPTPSLIRQLVAPAQLAKHLGFWGAYMPAGTALALLCGPTVITWVGWQGLWVVLAALTAAMAWCVARVVPAHTPHAPAALVNVPATGLGLRPRLQGLGHRLGQTLSHRGPWLVALVFAMYSSQWLAVVGFLPSVYAQAGVAATTAGSLTALVCAVNLVGNVGAGQLLGRGWPPQRLLTVGFLSMALGTWLAFHPLTEHWPALRYSACLLFSAAGGLVPGTLFLLAVRAAPSEHTVSTTVGWMQQCSSTGQFLGPPLVAWVADRVGGWHLTWAVTGLASVAGLCLVLLMARPPKARLPHQRG